MKNPSGISTVSLNKSLGEKSKNIPVRSSPEGILGKSSEEFLMYLLILEEFFEETPDESYY